MKVAIFGANGPTGRILTEQALERGHTVTAITRHPETFTLHNERLQVVKGDVFDLDAVERAVAGQDAVLSTLGVPYSFKPITVYSQGVGNIVEAMRHIGVRRLICVSSSATYPQFDPQGGFVFERVVQPLITSTIGKQLYEDMRRMESLVTQSDLDWTIVRPSGLFETSAVTPYHVSEAHVRGHYTSRADLADCMLRQLTTDEYVRKVVAVATVSEQPTLLRLIVREAFKIPA